MLTEERIIRYQAIYFAYYGREISREEAIRQGTKLIGLVKRIYRPILKSKAGKVN